MPSQTTSERNRDDELASPWSRIQFGTNYAKPEQMRAFVRDRYKSKKRKSARDS